jgi:hypothetical protein
VDISEIRTALKDTINTVHGLEVSDLCDSPNVPCAIVYPEAPFPFDPTFEQDAQFPRFVILILVSYIDTRDAQRQLDAYLSTTGDNSIIAAISDDPTLGGVVNSATVTELKSYGTLELTDGGTRYLSAELAIEIFSV